MKAQSMALLALGVSAHAASPVGKVISMISDLEGNVIKEGEVVQKEYAEFAEWCEDRARNLGFEIKTGRATSDSLKATIAEEAANIEALTAKVEELAADLATDNSDLKAATEIRETEASAFAAEDSELTDTLDMLKRATGILEREMQGGASMLQLRGAVNLAQAFRVMLEASLISVGDATKLTALVQDSEKSQDYSDDQAPGAPAASVYESHSGGIVDTLNDLTEKAESQLKAARNAETANKNNFEMLKQSLEDEIRFATKDMHAAKKGISESSGKKSAAEGDLDVTSKDLGEDLTAKNSLHEDCMSKASTFEAETKSRGEELKALATAKKVIVEATSSALTQVSLVQVSRLARASGRDVNYESVRIVRELARKQGSGALMQLASHMASAMHSGDAFEKVKGLISDMIAKLEDEAQADATKKAYCDKELKETNEKKADKTGEIKKLSTRIDQMTSRSAQLKEEVAALQSELAKLAKSQADMDRLREEEKATFEETKAELEKGLSGLKLALKVLNEYYAQEGKAHDAAEGAASGIIGLLEVCEADFSKNLAQTIADEESAVAEYTSVSKDNEIEKTTKDQDVKYKTKESKSLDKTSGELSADRSGVQAELDAVLDYLSKIEGECIAKAETYASRKARRESEIAGLKSALKTLESETSLVQRRTIHRTLRGAF